MARSIIDTEHVLRKRFCYLNLSIAIATLLANQLFVDKVLFLRRSTAVKSISHGPAKNQHRFTARRLKNTVLSNHLKQNVK